MHNKSCLEPQECFGREQGKSGVAYFLDDCNKADRYHVISGGHSSVFSNHDMRFFDDIITIDRDDPDYPPGCSWTPTIHFAPTNRKGHVLICINPYWQVGIYDNAYNRYVTIRFNFKLSKTVEPDSYYNGVWLSGMSPGSWHKTEGGGSEWQNWIKEEKCVNRWCRFSKSLLLLRASGGTV